MQDTNDSTSLYDTELLYFGLPIIKLNIDGLDRKGLHFRLVLVEFGSFFLDGHFDPVESVCRCVTNFLVKIGMLFPRGGHQGG